MENFLKMIKKENFIEELIAKIEIFKDNPEQIENLWLRVKILEKLDYQSIIESIKQDDEKIKRAETLFEDILNQAISYIKQMIQIVICILREKLKKR